MKMFRSIGKAQITISILRQHFQRLCFGLQHINLSNRLEQSFENKVSSDLVSEYMKAVDQKNETIKKQLEISNLLIRKLAEKLPDDDPSKVRMLELVNQLDQKKPT